jgi:hypothetical protein
LEKYWAHCLVIYRVFEGKEETVKKVAKTIKRKYFSQLNQELCGIFLENHWTHCLVIYRVFEGKE